MKKLITIILLLFSINLYAEQIKFKVRSNHYYEFHIPLKGNCTQYLFQLQGTGLFNFRILEPSSNEWQLHISDILENKLNIKENILDKGTYTIRIYSIEDNFIIMTWSEY